MLPRTSLAIKTTFAVIVLFWNVALGQHATLSGFVSEAATGRPLELVNVMLAVGDSLVAGDVTTSDGVFLLPRIRPGRYTVAATFVGYHSFVDTLKLEAGDDRTLSISLAASATRLEEAVVEADRSTGPARVTAGLQTIRPAEIRRIPSPASDGDLAGFLTTVPGIVSTADRGGQLFVRGGEPSQNLVLLDGIELYQPFHLLGFFSAFPSDLLQRADVYAGGYGSRFGGRISSVLDIATRNGDLKSFNASASLSPFLAGVTIEGPAIEDRLSYLFSGRRSLVKEAAGPAIGVDLPFQFSDVTAKLHAVVNERGRASATFLHTYDEGTLGISTDTNTDDLIRSEASAAGFRYLFLPDRFSSVIEFHTSVSSYRTEQGATGAPDRFSEILNGNLGMDITIVRPGYIMNLGAAIRLKHFSNEIGGLYQNVNNQESLRGQWKSYLEFDMNLGNGWRLQPGAHFAVYSHRITPYLEPRFRFVRQWKQQQISGAVGVYHQDILGLSDRRDAARVFTIWTSVPRPSPWLEDVRIGRLQRATHAILGYQIQPRLWMDVSIEGFYKQYSNLLIEEWTAFPRLSTSLQPATGASAGFDVRMDWRKEPVYGFVTYGLSSTRYEAQQAELAVWYGVEKLSFRPPHDRRHQITIVAGTTIRDFDCSLRWSYGSGLPFSRAHGFDGFLLVDDVIDLTEAEIEPRVIYEKPYNGRLPSYHRLDISIERSFTLGTATGVLQFSLMNAYNRGNLFYLDVFTLDRVNQLPLLPSIGLTMNL